MSGFTGSAGTLVVTERDAGLRADSRYWVQAQAQLAGTGIDLMKMAGGPQGLADADGLAKQLAAGAASVSTVRCWASPPSGAQEALSAREIASRPIRTCSNRFGAIARRCRRGSCMSMPRQTPASHARISSRSCVR